MELLYHTQVQSCFDRFLQLPLFNKDKENEAGNGHCTKYFCVLNGSNGTKCYTKMRTENLQNCLIQYFCGC